MRVTLLFFAAARDATGTAETAVELPHSVVRVEELTRWLGERYPGLAPYLDCIRIAQNERFATADAVISAGDVLAIIPPVAGG